jgi:hypothetical protein
MSGKQIKAAVEAIGSLKNAVYGLNRKGVAERLLGGATSAGLAGNPKTGLKIGASASIIPLPYRGIFNTLRSTLDIMVHYPQVMAEIRRQGLSTETIANLWDDPTTVSTAENRVSNIFKTVLNLAGWHAWAQNIARGITAGASRLWLENYAIPHLQADPTLKRSETRVIAEDIAKREMNPQDFAHGPVSQQLKDRFVREDVQDLQTAYRPEDYPARASGKFSFAFRFGHWAYNGARFIARDTVVPLAQATVRRDLPLAGRYFGRLLGVGAAAVGASELTRKIQELFGQQSDVATMEEIRKAVVTNDPEAAHLMVDRITKDLLGSPIIGMFGDVGQAISAVAQGKADTTHFFNPATPASVAYIQIITGAFNKWSQEGHSLKSFGQVVQSSAQTSLPRAGNTTTLPIASACHLGVTMKQWAIVKLTLSGAD